MAANRKSSLETGVKIVGEGTDELDQRYLKLAVVGSQHNLAPYSMEELLKRDRLYRDLGDAGRTFLTSASQRRLLGQLEAYQPQAPTFRVVTRLGAFPRFYVRPDAIIGKSKLVVEPSLGALEPYMLEKYRCSGSLEQWRDKIGQLCVGNSRLMFAVSLAFTGPILSLVGGPSAGGFQISGKAESGKTAAAMVAGSVWGCHRADGRREKGFAESWNTTLSEVEITAKAHSGALLILDETNLAGDDAPRRANVVLQGAFKLAEGTKRSRYNEPASAGWRVFFLSTSNLSVDELARAGRVDVDDQHRGRIVDVVLPTGHQTFGIYEDLHGFGDGAKLTDAIKDRCRKYYGTVGEKFVRQLYRSKDSRAEARSFLAKRRERYLARVERLAESQSVKPLNRASARFATVYAAGCLAIKYELVRWSRKELLGAILRCQFDNVTRNVAFDGQSYHLSPRQRVLKHLHDHQHEFVDLADGKISKGEFKSSVALGYRQDHAGDAWLYLT